MRKKLIIAGIVIVVLVGVFIGSFKMGDKLAILKLVDNPLKVNTVSKPITMMHHMANTLITDEVWFTQPMNKENVNEVIAMLNNTGEFEGRADLLVIASKW
jgi:hypothetical protein